MHDTTPAAAEARRPLGLVLAALLLLFAATIGALGDRSLLPSAATIGAALRGEGDGPGEADGLVSHPASVFDDKTAAVANLDPGLLAALRRAATHAAEDGIELRVNSGWRSPEYQEHLLRQAILEFGSEKKAARWVGTPLTSAHVSGDAVDIGFADAMAWLSEHGDDFGLCQIYRNEPWHFELRTEAMSDRCPRMYADPTRDPRMQR